MIKNYLSLEEANHLQSELKSLQNVNAGHALRTALQGTIGWMDNERYYVHPDGDDNNDGKSWDKPFATIQHACNVARYIPGTTTIDSSKDRRKYIFIYPGVYNEQILFSGYNISLIGLRMKLGNVDYGVVINKDEAVTTTCVVGFTGAGIEIAGLEIHNAAAIPALFVPTPGDGCWVHDNIIDNDASNATYGIQWVDCRNSVIENNKIYDFQTAGIAIGSNGTWFRESDVRGNKVCGQTGIGIQVVTGTICTARQGSTIAHNYVIGTCTVGIHQDEAGAYVLVADNWVQATTPVTDDGTGAADNHNAS